LLTFVYFAVIIGGILPNSYNMSYE